MSPVDVVTRYLEEIYHQGDVDLVREVCGDPLVRHDPGARSELSHDEQIARIRGDLEKHEPRFTWEVLAGDGRDAVLVWNCARSSGQTLSGIEVFRVVDGRITDVWNATYSEEPWR
ncbi:hypothetical protein DSM112329_01974 [Paraconexibacter sp. AEG42_29]|uniref:SnoaL-like domain-containing protein n=1 Tax=Paraconexibacter sp. AEG42_29 TaxID=2997339 RepID=A0AAU7ATV6_9ACTN